MFLLGDVPREASVREGRRVWGPCPSVLFQQPQDTVLYGPGDVEPEPDPRPLGRKEIGRAHV